MAQLIEVNGIAPFVHKDVWLADNAVITGDTHIGEGSSIWFHTVIRGDVNKIRIGRNVNIQDLTMVHGTKGRGDTIIGDHVSIGHRAIIHGCKIEAHVLVGMGAIILDDVTIPSHTIIAAGALVNSSARLESGYIYAGTPVRRLKKIEESEMKHYVDGTAAAYLKYREYYRKP